MGGLFLIFEGPDGSGTTTHSRLLADALKAEGKKVLRTAEPTDSPIGRFIRSELQKKTIESPSALQLLFCADRAWHIERVIKPALDAGTTVICDRYVMSTLIYGEALGLDPEWLLSVNTPFLEPDLVFVALPSFETCMERIGLRPELDVFEHQSFQRTIYDLYKRVIDQDRDVIHLDTGKTKDEVQGDIRKRLVGL